MSPDRERIETMVFRDQAMGLLTHVGDRLVLRPPLNDDGRWNVAIYTSSTIARAVEGGETEAAALRALLLGCGVQPWEFPQELGPTTTLGMLCLP